MKLTTSGASRMEIIFVFHLVKCLDSLFVIGKREMMWQLKVFKWGLVQALAGPLAAMALQKARI
jgi:hypothetical protein